MTQTLTLNNMQEVYDAIRTYIDDEEFLSDFRLEFSQELLTIFVKVDDENLDHPDGSSQPRISTGLAAGMVQIQNHINQIVMAGVGRVRASDTLKRDLELTFELRCGCTDGRAWYEKLYETAAKMAESLSPKDKFILLMTLVVGVGSHFGLSNYYGHVQATQKAEFENQQQTENAALAKQALELLKTRNPESVTSVEKRLEAAQIEVVRNVPGARSVQTGHRTFTKDEISSISARKPSESLISDSNKADYLVVSADVRSGKNVYFLKNQDGETFRALVDDSLDDENNRLTINQQAALSLSLANSRKINIPVEVSRKADGTIARAYIKLDWIPTKEDLSLNMPPEGQQQP